MSKAAILYGVWIPICMLIVSYIKDEKNSERKGNWREERGYSCSWKEYHSDDRDKIDKQSMRNLFDANSLSLEI